MNKWYFNLRILFFWLCILFLWSCFNKGKFNSSLIDEKKEFRLQSDDSLLTEGHFLHILPYNRMVQTAGSEVFFGDPNLENHALDCKILPDHQTLAVEDRYGIILINIRSHQIMAKFTYSEDLAYKGLTSTFSGIHFRKVKNKIQIFWSAASSAEKHKSFVLISQWDGEKLRMINSIPFAPLAPSPLALPNEVGIDTESGIDYLYVLLNGNNQLVKLELSSQKIIWTASTGVAPYGLAILNHVLYLTNWGGSEPVDTLNRETAGVPYGKTYINPQTGATSEGTVQSFSSSGKFLSEIKVGLHPNAIIADAQNHLLYTSCGNSDLVFVLQEYPLKVLDSISIKLDPGRLSYRLGNLPKYMPNNFFGDCPTALVLDSSGTKLYVANSMDNAVAVVQLKPSNFFITNNPKSSYSVLGFIPTGAYPSGLDFSGNTLLVTNLESSGAWVNSKYLENENSESDPEMKRDKEGAYNSHHQLASVSIIPVPEQSSLNLLTERVKRYNLLFRAEFARRLPRPGTSPQPVPLRVGEPSVFKHVIYIIKENRTYDQVFGDMKQGRGSAGLCVFGDRVTPNQHALARRYLLMDNFYASGKCSAEGHQWADAGMVTDYVEKNVRAWFRSYPHVQTDALVYTPTGFIWNDALDHDKSVRIYGEACVPKMNSSYTWKSIYDLTNKGKPVNFTNYSTISRVRPILSKDFPASDTHLINDVYRANAFIKELKEYENKEGDFFPNLMVMALSNDHTVGLRPDFPTPRAMVADNDLALGKIIDAVSHSRFYASTVIFVMEDDSQSGWDHISAYRTTGLVISPYSNLSKTITTNFNQTSVVRTIEQILGIPPMNALDATALPMFDCFGSKLNLMPYTFLPNKVALDEMNPNLSGLKGEALYWAKIALRPEYDHLDQGDDNLMNQMIWYAAMGKTKYPRNLSGKD